MSRPTYSFAKLGQGVLTVCGWLLQWSANLLLVCFRGLFKHLLKGSEGGLTIMTNSRGGDLL